jgi:diguanylate cyclase (GGDEF)-like protein
MLRERVDADVRDARARGERGIAPAPVRVALIAIVVAGVAAVVGGSDGFWLSVPGVLLAASVASSFAGAVCWAALVLAVGAAVASSVGKGAIPPLWLVVAVPGACVGVLQGIGQRLRRERDLMEQAAFSDPLTGLANRRLLMSMAQYEIARHRRADERFVVVMLDLDGFKQLNDHYGHAAGDQMLCDVAGALTRALRSQDTIARLGGDEFCVIAPETANARPLAEKIVYAVADAASGHTALRTSVGVSLFPEDGTTIEQLLRVADDRLLVAKRRRYASPQRRVA